MNDSNRSSKGSVACSRDVPLSGDFFQSISSAEKVLVGICCLVSLVTVIDYLGQSHYILNRYQTIKTVKYKSLEILGICPVVSLVSVITLFIPRAYLFSQLVSSIYISWCIYHFVTLMVSYLDGTEKMLDRLKDSRISLREPPCCCCCICLPALPVTEKNVRMFKIFTLQQVFLQPPMTFLTLALWVDGKFAGGQFTAGNAYPYLNVVSVVSSLLALYGHLVLFKLFKDFLKPVVIGLKFLAVQLIILFCQLQGMIFTILARNDIPACIGILSSEVRGQAYLQMALVIEMCILCLLGRYLYCRPYDKLSADPARKNTSNHYEVNKV